ncbi:MAG: NrsF family protein [Hyphomicrobium sp.]
MKTDELIRAVVADNASVKRPIGQTIALALCFGILAGALIFSGAMGPRPDFAWVLANSPRFDFKLFFTIAIAACAYILTLRLARPEPGGGTLAWAFAIPLAALAIGVIVELNVLPADHWLVYARGSNWLVCMCFIPLLSIAPFIAIFYALRQGAPANPTLAGLAGGLLAAGVGATLYATHCADDSPLFVSIWYPIGISVVAAIGALIGRRFLNW